MLLTTTRTPLGDVPDCAISTKNKILFYCNYKSGQNNFQYFSVRRSEAEYEAAQKSTALDNLPEFMEFRATNQEATEQVYKPADDGWQQQQYRIVN